MQIVVNSVELDPLAVIPRKERVSDDEFLELCQVNPDMRLERTAEGDVIIMPPTGSQTGKRNARLTVRLGIWAERDGRGQAFDSSAGFTLPDTSIRSPDASWVSNACWNGLTQQEQSGFAPLCPDFVIELMSPSDRLPVAKAKMQQYIDNGAQLGWLLDPDHKTAYIYRAGCEPEQLFSPERLTGEGPVAGFVLDLAEIWS